MGKDSVVASDQGRAWFTLLPGELSMSGAEKLNLNIARIVGYSANGVLEVSDFVDPLAQCIPLDESKCRRSLLTVYQNLA